jgi:hypothetical protein
MQKQVDKAETKEAEGYSGSNTLFCRVGKNAWVQCGADGSVLFDRGEVGIAQEFGKAFPQCEIRVTIGPWRCYDIIAQFNKDNSIIFIDIYSVRCPHAKSSYVTDLMTNAYKILEKSNQ